MDIVIEKVPEYKIAYIRKGYRFDEARPIIERYIVKMVNNHYCEICVPVY